MGRRDKSPDDATLDSLHAQMRRMRQERDMTLTALSQKIGYTKGYLSSIENGNLTPSEEIILKYEQELQLERGSLLKLLDGTGATQGRRHKVTPTSAKTLSSHAVEHQAINAAPLIRQFYGRKSELAALQKWLIDDDCTLISVLGIGGIGKTTLVAYLTEQIAKGNIRSDFEYIGWYSLQNTPLLSQLIEQWMQFFSDQPYKSEAKDSINALLAFFQEHRCLLILDDFQSLFVSHDSAGQYDAKYADYGELLQRIGMGQHQSCLLLTSREKPAEIPRMEVTNPFVQCLELSGITKIEEVKNFLKSENLTGSEAAWAQLITNYGGNPLALKLISAHIREIFDGDIGVFLAQGDITFGDISSLLQNQFERLSDNEHYLMYWLAIERGFVLLEHLKNDVAPRISGTSFFETCTSLRRRFLLDALGSSRFTLPAAILEYVTEQFIQRISYEILHNKLDLLVTHTLIKAQAEDYVRNDQLLHILQPIEQHLIQVLGRDALEQRLRDIIKELQSSNDFARKTGYAAGNILDLLISLKNGDISGFDFSHLAVRQAYLQQATLHNVDFSYADLHTSVFTETFKGITSVTVSPDGTLLAAGTITGEIWIWDMTNLVIKTRYKGDASWVCSSVAFSHDGQWLASGSEDRKVRLWNVRRGTFVKEFVGHEGSVTSVAFSPDNSVIASASEDQTVRFWPTSAIDRTMQIECLRTNNGPVRSVTFHPHPQRMMLATGSEDATIALWDTQSGERLLTLQESSTVSETVCSVAFSPNGKMLASGGKDAVVRLWDIDTGKRLLLLEDHDDWVWSVAFSHDSDTLASGSEDQTIRLWDVKTGECQRVLTGHHGRVWSVAFHSLQDILTSGSIDRSIRVWDVQRGVCLRVLQGYMNGIRAIAYNPRDHVLASACEDNNVYLWNTDAHPHSRYQTLQGHSNIVWSVAVHPDGKLVISGGDDKTIRFWNTQSGRLLDMLPYNTWIRSLAFRPDGEQFASGGDDGTIYLWDTYRKTVIRQLEGHKKSVRAIAFHPNCNLLASGSDDGTICLWRLDHNAPSPYKHLEGHSQGVWSLAFSPDGKLLASGSEDQTIGIWDIESDQRTKTLRGDMSWVGTVAFHPTRNLLASGGGDGNVYLWNIATGQKEATIRAHTAPVSCIAFTSQEKDGLISGSHDGTNKIWDLQNLQSVLSLQVARPYEAMNISHITGLNEAQIEMLRSLGAVEK